MNYLFFGIDVCKVSVYFNLNVIDITIYEFYIYDIKIYGGIMENCSFTFVASIPSVEDFGEKFRQYKNYAINEGSVLFNLLMSPESLIYVKVATEMGFPAVAGIAEKSVQEILKQGKKLTNYDKQFIGAVVCVLVEMNGYQKSGTKKTVPHKLFTKGEFYERKPV